MEKLEVEKTQTKSVQAYNEDKFYAIAQKVASDLAIPQEELPLIKQKAMSFYLAFKQVPDAEKCTKESIETAFRDALESKLDLSSRKAQAYLIKYGDKLTFAPSYRGRKRVMLENNKDIVDMRSQIIYEGDTFVDKILPNGRTILVKHERKPFGQRSDKPMGVYTAVTHRDGSSEIFTMTMAEVQKSWSKSRTSGAVHKEFVGPMMIKTCESKTSNYLAGATGDTLYAEINENEYEDENQTYDIPIDEEEENVIEITEAEPTVDDTQPTGATDYADSRNEDGSYVISYKEYLANKDKYIKIEYYGDTRKVLVKDAE